MFSLVNLFRVFEWMYDCLLKDLSTDALVGGKFKIVTATFDSWVSLQKAFHQVTGAIDLFVHNILFPNREEEVL